MVDWEEVLEDVNWKRGIAILLIGLICIGVAVFLGLDYHRYNTVRTLLDNDLKSIEDFQRTWSPPDREIKQLRKKLNELRAELEAIPVKLPDSLEPDKIESAIRNLAARDNVEIIKYETNDKTDGYCLIHEVSLGFQSNDPRDAANFLADLSDLPYPHTMKSKPVSLLRGPKELSLEFYSFDQAGWEEDKTCELAMTVPELPERDISGVKVFKKDLPELKAKVEQERAALAQVKQEAIEMCELQTEVQRLKQKLAILHQKAGL